MQVTKIQAFAKAQFDIELTDAQLQIIALIATGQKHVRLQFGRSTGITTANNVALAYLQDGLKVAK